MSVPLKIRSTTKALSLAPKNLSKNLKDNKNSVN